MILRKEKETGILPHYLLFSLYQWPFQRTDEQVEVRATCPYNGKLSLMTDESHVCQRYEDVERKWEYYHIIIFPGRTWNFISCRKRRNENHCDGTLNSILFHKSRPANKHHINQSINLIPVYKANRGGWSCSPHVEWLNDHSSISTDKWMTAPGPQQTLAPRIVLFWLQIIYFICENMVVRIRECFQMEVSWKHHFQWIPTHRGLDVKLQSLNPAVIP